jgi:type VI secretion system VasD/TssJ family lipoprotein
LTVVGALAGAPPRRCSPAPRRAAARERDRSMTRTTALRPLVVLLPLLALLLLAGCCPQQLLMKPCKITDRISIEASEELNTCDESGAHPVTLYIYSLAGAEAFRDAEFSALFDNDLKALGADKIDVIKQTVRPGESLVLKLTRADGVGAIGIVADFCQHSSNCWKRSVDLDGKGAKIGVSLGKSCMTVNG